MNTKVNVIWDKEMSFEANVNDHKITLDADEKVGGKDRGPRPKPLSLASLGGCTGMDVISILKKMRISPDSFDVIVEGHNTDEHPKHYDKIHIKYIFRGKDLYRQKIEKAVNLSQDRYCGVTHMLKARVEITHEIIIEE